VSAIVSGIVPIIDSMFGTKKLYIAASRREMLETKLMYKKVL